MKRSDISDVQVIRACLKAHADHLKFASEIIQEETGAPIKVIYAAMERADHRGLIDWGVSLRSAWATEKGKLLIS